MASRNSPRPGRKKGTPKTGGRKKGTPNKATLVVKEACALIVEDVAYRQNLLARARVGELAPAVECMLWHYLFGKPVEQHQVGGTLLLEDAIMASRREAESEGAE